jgi:hypothetical protein
VLLGIQTVQKVCQPEDSPALVAIPVLLLAV